MNNIWIMRKMSYVEIILIQVNSLKLDEHVGKSGSNSLDPQSSTKVNWLGIKCNLLMN